MCIAVTVNFNQTKYLVNQHDGPVQPVIVLSNPSSIDITVRVVSIDGTATGECVLHNMVATGIFYRRWLW